MLAAKSFEPVTEMAAMERWISLMAEELAARMATDYEENLRRPRNLIVHYRCCLVLGCRVLRQHCSHGFGLQLLPCKWPATQAGSLAQALPLQGKLICRITAVGQELLITRVQRRADACFAGLQGRRQWV